MKFFYKKGAIEAGCDEAGRGCLAGPVFAAAVILPQGYKNELLNDSKQLSEQHRNALRILIEEQALAFGVAMCDHTEIDEINILNASIKAMHRALDKLHTIPQHIIVDGNRFKPYKDIPHQCVVGGDAQYMSIAAASILAKTYRDEYMQKLHEEYPNYGWSRNKGYPTEAHRDALHQHGTTPYHRVTFNLMGDNQLSLF